MAAQTISERRPSLPASGPPAVTLVDPGTRRTTRRRIGRRKGGPAAAGASALVMGVLVWAVLAGLRVLPAYDLPTPRAVAVEWWSLATHGLLWSNTSTTLAEALLGFALAFGVSALLAYPLARSRLAAGMLAPYVAATQAMPILALAPLLVVWFGISLFSKTLICAIVVFFPITVNNAVGLRSVDRTLVEAAMTEGAGRLASLFFIEIPLAGRTILAGVRMGLTLSMTGAIIAEFVASSSGLGYLMMLARSEYNAPMLFAAATTMVALAVAGYLLVSLAEHLLIDWT